MANRAAYVPAETKGAHVHKRNPELARAMAVRGLSTKELAQLVGCDPKTASSTLHMRRRPSRVMARAFAAALNIDVHVLFPDLPRTCPACERTLPRHQQPATPAPAPAEPATPAQPTQPAPASAAKQ
jgi:transcriptional regulator with XRE-family HTH domain